MFLQDWEEAGKKKGARRKRKKKEEGRAQKSGRCLQIVPIIFIDELDVYMTYFGWKL